VFQAFRQVQIRRPGKVKTGKVESSYVTAALLHFLGMQKLGHRAICILMGPLVAVEPVLESRVVSNSKHPFPEIFLVAQAGVGVLNNVGKHIHSYHVTISVTIIRTFLCQHPQFKTASVDR
jgi:hypothetical protein